MGGMIPMFGTSQLKGKLSREQKTTIRKALNPLATFVPERHKLEVLARIHGTDKREHGYTRHYAEYFRQIRRRKLHILEIGVGGYQDPKSGANSLRMWQSYFPNSMIYGIDVADKRYHEDKRIKIFQGSQNDPAFLESLATHIGHIDIVIDDGSHINEHILTSFRALFPRLASPGIYVIEDIFTSYWPEYGGDWHNLNDRPTSVALIKSLIDGLHYQYIPNRSVIDFDRCIESVSVYPKIAFIFKGKNSQTMTPYELQTVSRYGLDQLPARSATEETR
jgi:demethylmacrocin O-methyltransferase